MGEASIRKLLGLLLLGMIACSPADARAPGEPARQTMSVSELTIRSWSRGRLQWTSSAQTAEIATDMSFARLAAPRFDDSREGYRMSAESGEVNFSRHEVTLGPQVMARASGTLVAVAREAGEEVAVDIAADHFLGRSKDGVGTFEGHVLVTRGEMRLKCEQLAVTYNRDQKRIDRMVATGAVVMETGGRRCTGAKVTFDQRGQRVILEGNPVLQDGQDEMRGDRIVWDLESDQVDCQRCRVRWTHSALPERHKP